MIYGLSLLIGVCLDQLTKFWATETLSFWVAQDVFGPLSFQLVHNYGAAYGIFSHQRLLLIAISVSVLLWGWLFRRSIAITDTSRWGMVFIAIGTIGNLIDRLWLGYVVDFINIQIIPVFNLADFSINIGVILFIVEFFWMRKNEVG